MYDNQANKKYGQVGGEVFIKWGDKLQFFKDKDIQRGLDNCENNESEYAPNLKTFVWYCEGKAKGLTHRTDAYKPFDKSKALTHKPDPEKVKSHLSKMRGILN